MNISNKTFIFTLLIITFCRLSGWSSEKVVKSRHRLVKEIDKLLSGAHLQDSFIGLMVYSPSKNKILYNKNESKTFMPASNLKIPVTAALLTKLGPHYRFETPFYIRGKVIKGILKGDLIVVGSGDPTISYKLRKDKESPYIFQALGARLKELGIHTIDGNIIGIDDIFDDEKSAYGWELSDISYYYAAQIGGLSFNENVATLSIASGRRNGKSYLSAYPNIKYLQLDNKLVVENSETAIKVERSADSNKVTVSGTILPGKRYYRLVTVNDPTLYFLNALKWELQSMKIKIKGKTIDADSLRKLPDLAGESPIYSHTSPPLIDILELFMKQSKNLYGENLIKLLGSLNGEEGSFKEGRKVLEECLLSMGIEPELYKIMDGSGLSRYNYISPESIVKVLDYMKNHQYGELFKNLMPISGVDGTLKYRMRRTTAGGKVYAKTGYLPNVNSLSGYVTTSDAETLIFSLIVNNHLSSNRSIRDLQNRLCILLSNYEVR